MSSVNNDEKIQQCCMYFYALNVKFSESRFSYCHEKVLNIKTYYLCCQGG